MKSTLPILIIFGILALGCSKDNNGTNPSIKVKSYTGTVAVGDNFTAVISFSQKNGSLSGDSLVIMRHRYNQTQIPSGEEKPDEFSTSLPLTPPTNSADFNVSLAWFDLTYGINNEPDTFDFRFVLIDGNGNHSDTTSTGKVVVLAQ
jgi:hypothetical protein